MARDEENVEIYDPRDDMKNFEPKRPAEGPQDDLDDHEDD